MTLTPIFNREPAPNTPLPDWVHLVPRGEFPHRATGLIQVLDDAALEAMANRFAAEAEKLRVDQDHFSYDLSRPSEAFGWIEELKVESNGLWARIQWTDLGAAALSNRRYRFLSPAWLPDDLERLGGARARPLRLDSAGLTNSPNLRGLAPLTNRAEPSGSADSTNRNASTTTRDMKLIATELGLSAEASEQSILDGIRQLKNRRAQLETDLAAITNRATAAEGRATELTAANAALRQQAEAAATAQIEADLAPLASDPIKNRVAPEELDALRKLLKADRAAALPILNRIVASLTAAAAPARQPVVNRADAQTPDAAKAAAPPTGLDRVVAAFKAKTARA